MDRHVDVCKNNTKKKWLDSFNLGQLYEKFEENGFLTMASVQVMEEADINIMFHGILSVETWRKTATRATTTNCEKGTARLHEKNV